LAFTTRLSAVEQAAELLPASTVLYVEIAQPAATMETILTHPIAGKVREHEAYQQATKSPKYKQFQTILKFIEAQLEMDWKQAVGKLTDGGVCFAVDAETEGVAIIFQAESAEALEKIKTKVMQLARQDAENKGKEDPYEEHAYREVPVFKTGKGVFATYDNWLVVVNKPDLGRHILDALLDDPQASLADQPLFQQARNSAQNQIVWAYANLESLRSAGVAKDLFRGKTDEPGGELILGGVLEILKQASYVTAALDGLPDNLQLSVSLPFQADWISEEREHYFGPGGKGSITSIRTAGESIASLSVYRDVSQMWLRAGDLFNAEVNDGFAKADATLTTLFSGKDFGEDILGSLSPELQIVVARQSFTEGQPVPDIKLPGFALVARMKNAEQTRPEFRRLFMSFIGFLNIVAGSEKGRAQLDLQMESLDSGELISTRFVPPAGSQPDEETNISYNFTPSVAFQDDLFILSSSSRLARELLSAPERPIETKSASGKAARVNLALNLSARGIRQSLEDNREHLVAQNILKKGQSPQEAEREIGTLFELLKLVESAGLRVLTTDETFEAHINVKFAR
jgi:hypothetical protein